MEIEGYLLTVLPTATGVSQQGKQWTKQSFIIKTKDEYPKDIHLIMFGDVSEYKPDMNNIPIGSSVTVSFDPESREFQGRWYTDLRAWKVVVNEQFVQIHQPPIQQTYSPTNNSAENNELPF